MKNVELKNAGIIPAYAGNTYARPKRATGTRDHPRVCGEHATGWNEVGLL